MVQVEPGQPQQLPEPSPLLPRVRGGSGSERGASLPQSLHEAHSCILSWQRRYDLTAAQLAEAEAERAALQTVIVGLRQQVSELEQELAGLRQRNQDLVRKPFGFRSEKRRQAQPGGREEAGKGGGQPAGARRKRGGQPGSSAHKRVQRGGLAVREELLEPEADACRCAQCGLRLGRNGETVSERVEIEVQAHIRRIRRPRYRAVCGCAERLGEPPPEAQAALPPALFRGTGYGLSVWVLFCLQVFWQRRPARAFAREWQEHGVRLPVSTLLGHIPDFQHWFAPLTAAIRERQQGARVVHGDETSWIVHVRAEQGQRRRCWLWACLTEDALLMAVDSSRSAQAAGRVFGHLGQRVVLVCDRYAAYKRFSREHAGELVLAYCWAHVRRDWLTLGRSKPQLQAWTDSILGRIGKLYGINRQRRELWDPQRSLQAQSAAFQAQQRQLEEELAALFGYAEEQLQRLSAHRQCGTQRRLAAQDPRLKPLRSLLKHREGLEVFAGQPAVPMDNNPVERALRRPVVGRKLSYGSHSQAGAELQAAMLSVCGTLTMWGIDLQRWLELYLTECARSGPRAVPPDAHSFLPWGMCAQRRQSLQLPAEAAGPDP